MCSDAFERRLSFSFTIIILVLKQFCKTFVTKALEYKANLNKLTDHYLKTCCL